MSLKSILILTLAAVVSTEPPAFGNRFNTIGNIRAPQNTGFDWTRYPIYGPPNFPTHRPQYPQDSYGVPVIYNPNQPGYPQKPASYYRGGNGINDLPKFDKPLFTPTNGIEFAATNGQIDNFNKALQEDAQQQLQQLGQGREQTQTAFANGFTGYSNLGGPQQPAKSYVSVKFGQPNGNYNYQF